MAKFPEPPPAAALARIAAEIYTVGTDTQLYRIYSSGGPSATTWGSFRMFGPLDARFDHHDEPARVQVRGIFYGALRWLTCFAEVFQATRLIDRARNAPAMAVFAPTRALQLLDLRNAWPTRASASAAINSGMRSRARRWSRAIYDAYPSIDGLAYWSSMDGGKTAVALYERAAGAVPAVPLFNRLLSDPALWSRCQRAAREFKYDLV